MGAKVDQCMLHCKFCQESIISQRLIYTNSVLQDNADVDDIHDIRLSTQENRLDKILNEGHTFVPSKQDFGFFLDSLLYSTVDIWLTSLPLG